MITAGLDIGSTATKAVLYDGKIRATVIRPTGWDVRATAREVLEEALTAAGVSFADLTKVVVTGYGRQAVDFAAKKVTEITCHARGVHHLFPEATLLIDVGGQDSKVVRLGPGGRPLSFRMNDKCAAGTGRFLQLMAGVLGMAPAEMDWSEEVEPVNINSMCAVFAESEVVGLLGQGVAREKIVAGLFKAVAARLLSMLPEGGTEGLIVFTGGGALWPGLRKALERGLNREVVVPEDPRFTGALGAALLAAEGN